MTDTKTHQVVHNEVTKENVNKRARADSYCLNSEFLKLMVSMKAENFHPSTGIIYTCKRDEKIVDVWKGLIKYEFWSCPVLQKTKSKYYGFVDLEDIVSTVVEIYGSQRLKNDEDFWEAMAKEDILQKKTVSEVMTFPLSKKNPFHPVTKGFSLFSAVELLAKENGLHRVPIIDKDRKLINIITQSQVIKFFCSNLNHIGTIKDKPIRQMKNVHNQVVKISENETAIEAFKTMHYMGITGLAIVNDDGKLVGAISHSDLKLIQSDGRMFWRLYQSVKHFVQKNQKEGYDRPLHVVVADNNETIESALKKLERNKIHRIFIVDDHQRPIGIITLKDILAEIISCE